MIYDSTDIKRGKIRTAILEFSAFTIFMVAMIVAYSFVSVIQ